MDEWCFHENLQQVGPTDLIKNDLRQTETGMQSKRLTLCLFLSSSIGSWWRFEVKPGEVGQPWKHLPAPVPARAPGHTDWGQQSRWGFTTAMGGCPWSAPPASTDTITQLPGICWNTTLCIGNKQLSFSHLRLWGNLLSSHACSSTLPDKVSKWVLQNFQTAKPGQGEYWPKRSWQTEQNSSSTKHHYLQKVQNQQQWMVWEAIDVTLEHSSPRPLSALWHMRITCQINVF